MRRRSDKLTVTAAFARLRDGICLRAGGPPQVVVISSARRGEGRSAVASGLARALTRLDATSVALVDCDLRQPALHARFGVSASPGVSEVLRGKAKLAAARQSVEGGAISLLTAGAESQDAIPLLGTPAFSSLLSELRSQTVVVVDAAPLESGPEAEILAAAADGVVLVVCADQTTEQEAQLAAARLSAAAGGPLLGVVLNQARRGEMLLGGTAARAEDWLEPEATKARAPR